VEIAPLEEELKYLVKKINQNQLLIMDDYLKIKHHFLFDKNDWKSKLSSMKIKQIILNKNIKFFEVSYYCNS
jgi:hypothetical protein